MATKRFHKFLNNLSNIRLYSRLMIFYTLIFLIVTYAFAFAASSFYTQYNTVKTA